MNTLNILLSIGIYGAIFIVAISAAILVIAFILYSLSHTAIEEPLLEEQFTDTPPLERTKNLAEDSRRNQVVTLEMRTTDSPEVSELPTKTERLDYKTDIVDLILAKLLHFSKKQVIVESKMYFNDDEKETTKIVEEIIKNNNLQWVGKHYRFRTKQEA